MKELIQNQASAKASCYQSFVEFDSAPSSLTAMRFIASIANAISKTENAELDYEKIVQLFFNKKLSLLECISKACETSIQESNTEILTSLTGLADLTAHDGLRFLAAWFALNSNDLQTCIDQCNRCTHDSAQMLTLKGQALLETSQIKPAIEALSEATKYDANEILAWFQLAKAYYAIDKFIQAYTALNKCLQLEPNNSEIKLFLGFVALHLDQSAQQRCCQLLLDGRHPHSGNAEYCSTLLALAIGCDDKSAAVEIIETGQWMTFLQNKSFQSQLAELLRQLERKNWWPESRALLEKLT